MLTQTDKDAIRNTASKYSANRVFLFDADRKLFFKNVMPFFGVKSGIQLLIAFHVSVLLVLMTVLPNVSRSFNTQKQPFYKLKKTNDKKNDAVTLLATNHKNKQKLKNGQKKIKIWKEPFSGIEFVWVSGGCFMMGQTELEKKELLKEAGQFLYDYSYKRELPRHEVCVDGFWIGRYEVTVEQFSTFMKDVNYGGNSINAWYCNDIAKPKKYSQEKNHPVSCVSWNDSNAYINWISKNTNSKLTFRLPTEAEWEYACRAGTKTPFYFGNTINPDQANYDGNYTYGNGKKGLYRKKTTPVGSFPANAFGLFDMHGNVSEWCKDIYDENAYTKHLKQNPLVTNGGSQHVLRGGCWNNSTWLIRSALRYGYPPDKRSYSFGFRLIAQKNIITEQAKKENLLVLGFEEPVGQKIKEQNMTNSFQLDSELLNGKLDALIHQEKNDPESLKKELADYINKEIKDPNTTKALINMINEIPADNFSEIFNQVLEKVRKSYPVRKRWGKMVQQVHEIYKEGNYLQGVELAKKAYQYALQNFGEKDYDTLISIHNLAVLYKNQSNYAEAEPLYKHFLQLSEKKLGPKHIDTLTGLNNLASLYESQGRYAEAEPLYNRCFQLREEVLGSEHPHTISSMSHLSGLYFSQRRFNKAIPLIKRCFQLRKKILGPKHPDTINSANNLAGLYQSMGELDKAETFYKLCLQLRLEILGSKHPDTLKSINNLAATYFAQERYAEAEQHFMRLLLLNNEVLGKKHPDTSIGMYNLARLYMSQGNYSEAEPLYKNSFQLFEEILGPKHPRTLSSLLHYSVCMVLLNQENKALLYLKKLERSLIHFAGYVIQHSEKLSVRRKSMLWSSLFQGVLLSVAFQSNHPEIKAYAGDVILRWKCLQKEVETTKNYIINSTQDPKIIKLGSAINDLRSQINFLNEHIDINRLIKQLEQKELELSNLSEPYQKYLKKAFVRMSDLSEILPPKTALIELQSYPNFDLKTNTVKNIRLAATLTRPNGTPIVLEDLGPMKKIVLLYESIAKAKSQKATKLASKKLYAKLFSAFDRHIQNATTLYICPDGFTNHIPFSALILPDGRFWIERQNLCRLQTSRDLLHSNIKPINKGTLVAMGGIDFNQFQDTALEPSFRQTNDSNKKIRHTAESIESFNSLPFSTIEVESIKVIYQLTQNKKPLIFRGSNANEFQLKHLSSPPHVLHLATHAFYLNKRENSTERPMLLSGLALAGSNLGLKGRKCPKNNDGILYAIEVTGLNLNGTELVVLSACNTGKGSLDYSESVYGLLRAFQLAGAHNILMTLWPIYDQSSSDFMSIFYKNWLGKSSMTTSKALRQTQLSFIKQKKNFLLWAPYVLVSKKLQ